MTKKIFIPILILLILIGGGFFWWQNQKDVRELNKNLPEGVRVVKSLIGREYKVVNKIDGYEFKMPKEWRGVENIDYYYDQEKNTNRIVLEEPIMGTLVIVGKYLKEEKPNIELNSWVLDFYQNLLLKFGEALLEYQIEEENIGNYKLVKVKEGEGQTFYVISYFFQKGSIIYEVRGFLNMEDSIREIIFNGKW